MATNLAIDAELLETALRIGGLKTKKDTVNQSLKEFIHNRQSEEILALFGTIDYDEGYDYKAARAR